MRNDNTFGIHFILRMNKVKNGKAPLYARLTVNASRIEVSLKTLVEISDWNPSKGLAKPKNEKAKELNSFLEQVRGQFGDCYKQLQLQKKIINAEAIKNLFLGNEKSEHTLCSLIEYHNTNMKTVLSHGTLKNYFTTSKYLGKFLKAQHKTADIYLTDLNYQFISEFELFLRKHIPTDHQKKLQNNGVMKHLERLRKMVRLAVKMEWISKNPFENYQLKFQKVERSYLTDTELSSIEDKEFTIERLVWVRDLFVFSCYTGLAYIDTMKLSPSNIVRGIDGEYWLITSRKKTEVAVKEGK